MKNMKCICGSSKEWGVFDCPLHAPILSGSTQEPEAKEGWEEFWQIKQSCLKFNSMTGEIEMIDWKPITDYFQKQLAQNRIDVIEEIEGKIERMKQTPPFRVRAGVAEQNPKKDECPWCWGKGGNYHQGDCKYMQVDLKNRCLDDILDQLK